MKVHLINVCLIIIIIIIGTNENWKKPIEVKFEIPYFTVSGLQVRSLIIFTKLDYLYLYCTICFMYYLYLLLYM